MTCKKCSYILYGSENYCPHCGEKNQLLEGDPAQNETAEPQTIFTPRETRIEDINIQSRIFQPEPPAAEPAEKATHKAKSKTKTNGKGAVIFLSVLCVLLFCVAAVMTMDYFDIAPAVADFLSPREETTEADNLVSEREFGASFGTIEPQVNFTSTVCIVSSAQSISLRKGPDDAYAQIDTLTSGCEVQVIGGSAETNDWAYVYVPEEDLYGWVCTSYISGDIPLSEPEQTTAETEE